MKDLNNIPEFSRYFRTVKPSEINIQKEEIFYRDKYNDIINFLKVMLTNHEDISLNSYLEPRGAILINSFPGTDIVDYIKLITKNYYLDLIEFKENEILKSPTEFMKIFISIFEALEQSMEKEGDEIEQDKIVEKKLFLIDQKTILKQKIGEDLLEKFFEALHNINFDFKFIDMNLVLVWINYDIQGIKRVSNKIYSTFDLFIKIPLLNKIERQTVLKDFLEKNTKIVFDINDILNYTENWEVKDINQLLKVGIFKHFLNSELNETSNEITDILIDLILSGEYIPDSVPPSIEKNIAKDINSETHQDKKIVSTQKVDEIKDSEDLNNMVKEIRESNISEFMLSQLYENAASKNYTELVLIIDKLSKKEPLEDNDMRMLAEYPFILNDSPNKAQINLEKAKKRVDLIKQAFGK